MARKNLRTGFSTGTAATAATMAAIELLISDTPPETVGVRLPSGDFFTVTVGSTEKLSNASAKGMVIKDGGDDPDVTHKAAIRATVEWLPEGDGEQVVIEGGEGVGTVTRPGLPISEGRPAINPVPLQMIRENSLLVLEKYSRAGTRVRVVISVDKGEELARRTLNPRLGIVGGISILGTSGLVKPFSHEAYTATIESALSVVKALNINEVVLTTGGRSEKHSMAMRPDLPDTAFVQIADFFGFALGEARRREIKTVGLVSFFGKAVKQAQGLEYTHAHKAPMDLARLSDWLVAANASTSLAESVREANTARHALEILRENEGLQYVPEVGVRMLAEARNFLGDIAALWAVILDYDGAVLFDSRDMVFVKNNY